MCDLSNVSTELLLYIFEYCDICTLCRLRQCCRKFNELISSSRTLFLQHAIVTNQHKSSFVDRCQTILTRNEKWRIAYNWKIGRFRKSLLLKQNVKNIPWLVLSQDLLWLSEAQNIHAYRRTKRQLLNVREPVYSLGAASNQDVTKFVYKNGLILSGVRLGGLWMYSTVEDSLVFYIPNAHSSDVTCVDINNDIFVTGSRDKTFKIWPLQQNYMDQLVPTEINIGDKIWSIGLSPKGSKVIVGSAGYEKIAPLHIYDLHKCSVITSLGHNFAKGSGILDIHWEDENILLTCGYDTYLRKWDLRTGQCIHSWMDPHDSAYYCLASDDLYTIMCGSNVFGRVILWDQRSYGYIQMYYTHRGNYMHRSSPVYSMSFDSCQLFAALDSSLALLDFSVRDGKVFNYNLPTFQYHRCYKNFQNENSIRN